MRVCSIHAVAVLGLSLCAGIRADTYSWNFTGSTATTTGSFTFNNSSPAGGPVVTATAWYVNGGNLLQQGTLGRYSDGLGVCNPSETCSSPHHQVDNSGQLEFILFQFSAPLTDFSFTINPSPDSHSVYNGNTDGSGDDNVPDRDVSFFAGSPALGGSLLSGVNFNTMGTLFNTASGDIAGSSGSGALTVNLNFAGSVNAILFGALDTLNSNPLDFFKVTSMAGSTVTPPSQVPEPGSVVLLGTILLGVTYAMRKRSAA